MLRACPVCLTPFETAAADGVRAPVPGELALCVECHTLVRFTARLQVERVAEDGLSGEEAQQVARIRALLTACLGERGV